MQKFAPHGFVKRLVFTESFFKSELLYNHGFNYILFELIVFMAYQELVTVLYSSGGGGGARSRLVFRISVSRFLCSSRLHFDCLVSGC